MSRAFAFILVCAPLFCGACSAIFGNERQSTFVGNLPDMAASNDDLASADLSPAPSEKPDMRMPKPDMTLTCSSPTPDLCAGICVDKKTDNRNCGACGNVCSDPTNGHATCGGGFCGFDCLNGFHACGNTCIADGVLTCPGACTPCPPPPQNGSALCNGSMCDFVCNPGYQKSASGTSCVSVTAMPLDSQVSVPDASGTPCTIPGAACAGGGVCRFFNSLEGRCEGGCGGSCKHLQDPCTTSAECDTVFQCYRGKCQNFCTLGMPGCLNVAACTNIGHATYGLCND